jgi:hypothetical protein
LTEFTSLSSSSLSIMKLLLTLSALAAIMTSTVSALDATATGDEQVPPITSTASADATFTYIPDPNEPSITWSITLTNPDGVELLGGAGAHLHCGPAGETGPVVVALLPASVDTNATSTYTGTITNADVSDDTCGINTTGIFNSILLGNLYLNIHSTENADGELRSQLVSDPEPLVLPLSGDLVVPAVTSTVTGDVTLVIGDGVMGYTIAGSNPDGIGVFGAAGAHIHCGAAGENGDVVLALVGPSSVTDDTFQVSGIKTDAAITDDACGATVADLFASVEDGSAYIAVHSDENPGGELRAQAGDAVAPTATTDAPTKATDGAAATTAPKSTGSYGSGSSIMDAGVSMVTATIFAVSAMMF